MIVEYVNVSPSVTGIETGSVATVVGCMLGVPNCVPASVRPSMMIAPFALPAAAPAGATAASDATSARAMNPALCFNWSPSVAFGGVAPAPRRVLYPHPPALTAYVTSAVSSSINPAGATTIPLGSGPSCASAPTVSPAASHSTPPAAMSQTCTPRS